LLQLDITREESVTALVSKIRPNVLVHAANYSSVDWCDRNPAKAQALNFEATKHVARAARAVDAKLLFISSAAVGKSDSLYARYKSDSETYIQKILNKKNFFIIRPSVIFGASPFVPEMSMTARLLRYMADPSSCELDDSWKFYPTHMQDVLAAVAMGISGRERTSIMDVHVPAMKTAHEIALDISRMRGSVYLYEEEQEKDPYVQFVRSLARELASLEPK
jgi:dTDP-4-dehydrorhamnose reductase